MKMFSFKKISLIFTMLILFAGIFSVLPNNNNSVLAEEIPSYFSVTRYQLDPDGNKINSLLVSNNGTAFVNSSYYVEAKLEHANITHISPFFSLNGTSYSNAQLEDIYGIVINYQTNKFTLTSSSLNEKIPYGKYSLNIQYMIFENGSEVSKSFSFTYFVLLESDYFRGEKHVAVTYNKSENGSSLIYDKIFMYNYQDEISGPNVLPQVTFNKTRFSLSISKTYQSLTKTQTFMYNGNSLVVSGDNIVKYYEDGLNVSVVFNDLGSYVLNYGFIYTNAGVTTQLNSHVGYKGNLADRIDVFGYQLFYSDTYNGTTQEFKNINSAGIIQNEVTDISYLYPASSAFALASGTPISDNVNESWVLNNILNNVSNQNITIQQTNQVPLEFKYNVSITTEPNVTENNCLSGIWKLTKNGDSYVPSAKTVYTNTPLSDEGIYVVKVVYSYNNFVGAKDQSMINSSGSQTLFSQWFIFEITKNTPSVEINEITIGDVGQIIVGNIVASDSFTNKSVQIKKVDLAQSMFNAATRLMVYTQNNYTGAYSSGTLVSEQTPLIVADNANYIVTMYYGKNYSRSYSSSFTIDKTSIENIQFFAAEATGASGYYQRQNEIAFWTNQSVCVSWNEKHSNAQTFSEYKFIPLLPDTSIQYTNEVLRQFYNYYAVPNSYCFNFINQELTRVPYSNNSKLNYIPSLNVLSESGMYIFKFYDEAGNEEFKCFVIDKTEAKILQQIGNVFVEPSELNILSNDVTVSFGKNKVLRFNNLTQLAGNFNTNDEWLNTALNKDSIYETYFDVLTINTVNNYYLSSQINTSVLVDVNGLSYRYNINEQNSYSYEIKFINETTNQAQEDEYNFYIRDSVNTKTISGLSANSDMNYKTNYSGQHSIKISSDASLTELYFNKNSKKAYLSQDSYSPNPTDTTKEKYFIPTTQNTLTESNEILYLMFNAIPEPGVLEILTVTYEFEPFRSEQKIDGTNKAFTYTFGSSTNPVTIYDKNNPSENKAILSGNSYIWEVQKEYDPITEKYQTKAGRYVITRIYDNSLSGAGNSITNNYDYEIRKLVFIVDRNGIVSSPVVIDSQGNTTNYVGESIKIQVLENDISTGTSAMFFKDVYIASNISQSSTTEILSTNKLPVQVYVPVVKYGYSYTDGGEFVKEPSINYYNQLNRLQSEITSFKLRAEIRFNKNRNDLNLSSTIYHSTVDPTSTYLKFNSSSTGRAFTEVGFYKVTIYQGSQVHGENVFSFIFEITQDVPEFTVNSTDNIELQSAADGTYYTNKETIRLQWIDSSNIYMAKINKNKITYTLNGGQPTTISADKIQTSGTLNYVDLNLQEIGAYVHGCNIKINMQFEGNAQNYNSGYFSTSRTVIVDTIAPTRNINALVSASGITHSLLRNVTTKYNTSVSTGLYKYYSFPVDASLFDTILDLTSYSNGEAYELFFRPFVTIDSSSNEVNTKYVDIYPQETTPAEIESSISQFQQLTAYNLDTFLNNNNFKYIEIIERDIAGNITIYTIYLSSKAKADSASLESIHYLNNTEDKIIEHNQLSAQMDLFAKGSLTLVDFNFYNFDWLKISIGGKSYLKTPYLGANVYDLSIYDASNPSKSIVSISSFLTLMPSTAKQIVTLSLVPYFNTLTLNISVLNTALAVMHTSTTSTYSAQEGVLIRIPSTAGINDASIYAVSVTIYQYIGSGTLLTPQVIYSNNSQTFFRNANQNLATTSTLAAVYVNYLGNTYIKFNIPTPINNRFYKYVVIDNFGDEYPITNIYGSETIEKELTSAVDIVTTYEDNVLWNYSTKPVYFKYNSAKDRIILTVTTTFNQYIFDLSLTTDATALFNSGFGELLLPAKNSYVYTLKLNAAELSMAEGKVGGLLTFEIKMFETIDTSPTPYKIINVKTYNIIPHINLTGIENDNQNDLFNKGTMYGNQIKITFAQIQAYLDCEVYLVYPNGTIEAIESGKTVSDPGTYNITIKYKTLFTSSMYDIILEFTISNNEEDFYNVIYTKNGERLVATLTGAPFTYNEGGSSHSIASHYIINTSEFDIIYNTAQGVTESTPTTVSVNGFTTYIYKLSNTESQTVITKFFSRTIAITVIPETSSVLVNFSHYKNDGTRENLTGSLASFVVSTEEDNSTSKRLAWTSYYGIPENKVNVEIYYGDKSTLYTPQIETINNLSTITLSASGTYYLVFTDISGNVHLFEALSDTFTIRYLRNVIFTIQGETPISNAIYDKSVEVAIPKSTVKYYDSTARPSIFAERNGVAFKPTADNENLTYTFTQPGLYKVWFKASTGGVAINEEPTYFLIINPQETRWAFEFSEYGDYYVKQVIKNGKDVTKELSNPNMGTIIYKDNIAYVKGILISLFDEITGKGRYTITIATDNSFNQTFSFSLWINDEVPPIQIFAGANKLEDNSSTTNTVRIIFNTQNLLDSVGDCIIRVNNYEDLVISSALLEAGLIKENYELTLSRFQTYYIQVLSESGKLLYSQRVIRNEPLNTTSYILIVVSIIVVIGLSFLFYNLRRRMKIR